MKKHSNLKLFGLMIFLSVTLIFVGINFLEAKKPPQVQWEVTIPPWDSGYNLYGTNGGTYVNDDTDVNVSVEKRRGKNPYYLFKLRLINTTTWEDPCTPEAEYYEPGQYTVGFQDISLNPNPVHLDEGACFFPNSSNCSFEDPLFCMQCFLNNWEHPSSWACEWCALHERWENRGYRAAYVQIKIFDDIEAMPIDPDPQQPYEYEIGLYISVYTGKVTNPELPFWHDIEIHRPENVTYVAQVTRLNEDSWQIIFNLDKQEPGTVIEFDETYMEVVGELKPKGKSGKFAYDYEEYTPMIAEADNFSLKTTWTRK